jgi:fatty-acyl-CoA synthase
VVEAVVSAVPDATAGDQVMAAVVAGEGFDPAGFAHWVAEQPEASPQWVPRYLRVAADLPRTATGKVLVRRLVIERWAPGEGEVWVRDGRSLDLRPFTADDAARLERSFEQSGRLLPA